jgi:hypothetical protein
VRVARNNCVVLKGTLAAPEPLSKLMEEEAYPILRGAA